MVVHLLRHLVHVHFTLLEVRVHFGEIYTLQCLTIVPSQTVEVQLHSFSDGCRGNLTCFFVWTGGKDQRKCFFHVRFLRGKWTLRSYFIAWFKKALHKLYVTIKLLITEVKFQIDIDTSKKIYLIAFLFYLEIVVQKTVMLIVQSLPVFQQMILSIVLQFRLQRIHIHDVRCHGLLPVNWTSN